MKRGLITLFFMASGAAAAAGEARADTLIAGPDATSDAPFVVDTAGEIETTFRALGTRGTKSRPSRWRAELEVLIHAADIASDDVLVIEVRRGRKRLGKPATCAPAERFEGTDLALFKCLAPGTDDYDAAFTTAGKHTLSLTLRRVVAGKEHEGFATLEVYVEKLAQGSRNDPYVAWSTDHDMKLAVTTVEEKVENSSSRANANVHNAIAAASRKKGVPYLALRTWFKRERGLVGTKATCFYGDKRVAEANSAGGRRYTHWTHGKRDREQTSWNQATYLLYALHPSAGPDGNKGTWAAPQHWMNENPGAYRCVITGGGEILKTVFFEVGAGGEIVKPDCQTRSFNALRSVTLARTEDRQLSSIKADLARGRKRAFEGRVKWARGCPLARSKK